ncbi:unnamed protein product [Rotaria sordida]|uniref:Uncharacterized protein n=2 Tax=Rotaria sordida TaxID=392033 RepID=A0A814PVA5_9BILA|nr:unnamed protein product [Rotaria sordida]
MGNSGFHGSSIDIFETTEKNCMDSSHFLAWIDRTACLLRNEFGKYTKIVFVINNAPWHNRLTNDTMPPKRSWRKEYIIQWLNAHNINIPVKAAKTELLEIPMKNLPEKRYEIDEAAKKYNVDILRNSHSTKACKKTAKKNVHSNFGLRAPYKLPLNENDLCEQHRTEIENEWYRSINNDQNKSYWKPVGCLHYLFIMTDERPIQITSTLHGDNPQNHPNASVGISVLLERISVLRNDNIALQEQIVQNVLQFQQQEKQTDEILEKTLSHLSMTNDNLTIENNNLKEEVSNLKHQMNRLIEDKNQLQIENNILKQQVNDLQ